MTDAPIANSDDQYSQVRIFIRICTQGIFFGSKTCHSIQIKYPISERIRKFLAFLKWKEKNNLPLYPHS